MTHTIFALSSGSLPSGVAVIRVSGPSVREISLSLIGQRYDARSRIICPFIDPYDESVIDKGLFLFFPNPYSFTGEDVCEFHCHGGVATVNRLLMVLGGFDDTRMAEPGEFSKRAFENGKMDLTAVEGLSDLLSAQTESQRLQALKQSSGVLFELYDGWRTDLIQCRALLDASFDFSDEGDIEDDVASGVWPRVEKLSNAIQDHLDDNQRGEIVRNGYHITLMGPPNSGKSSLLNALAKRDISIVTEQAGTTRDVVSVSLDIGGQLVIVSDTAGIRDADDIVEIEGIRRSYQTADSAHLVLWLEPYDEQPNSDIYDGSVLVRTKSDLTRSDCVGELSVTTIDSNGTDSLVQFIRTKISDKDGEFDNPALTRTRHRLELESSLKSLLSSQDIVLPNELRSEFLREAGDCLGRLSGRIDVEDLLDAIFSDFCIGK